TLMLAIQVLRLVFQRHRQPRLDFRRGSAPIGIGTALGCLLLTIIAGRAAEIVIQPGPDTSKDIWTTSVYSYAPGGGGPGGGLADDLLKVGGWGDEYRSLLQFDLTGAPTVATSAVLTLYNIRDNGPGSTPTPMQLYRITALWDWRTMGTGSDHE